MKKIMIMTNSLYGGGAERILQTLLNHLDYHEYDVTLYSLHEEPLDENIYHCPIRYKSVFRKTGSSSFRNILEKVKGKCFQLLPSKLFYFLFIRGRYDVEVAFIEGESTKIVSGSTNRNSKKIAWVHVDLLQCPWTDFLYKNPNVEAQRYRAFDEILCVSAGVRDAFLNKYNVNRQNVDVQYNPLDVECIAEKALEQIDVKQTDRLKLITVGRLVKQKGYDRLLHVVKRLINEGYKFDLLILGEGEERESLQQQIVQDELSDYVSLPGFLENPYPYMANSDIFVCSSRAEGYSTVITEAVVLGLPIVSTDCAGVREIFGTYECGVITPNDEEGIYQGLLSVLSNPDLLIPYKAAALERGAMFSLQNTMHQIEERFHS